MTKVTFNLLGPQGSGKGTQAKALVSHFDFFLFEAGETLRKIRATGTPLGQQIASYIDAGNRVPDELMTKVLADSLKANPSEKDILFDSIMRSLGQLHLQRTVLTELAIPLPAIIFLNLDDEEAIERLGRRRICVGCKSQFNIVTEVDVAACRNCGGQLVIRHDDTKEVIKQRLALYHRDTKPVIDWFRENGTVLDIDARPAIAEVTKEIIRKVTAYYREKGLEPPIKKDQE